MEFYAFQLICGKASCALCFFLSFSLIIILVMARQFFILSFAWLCLSICAVKERMASYCSHMLIVTFGLLLLAIKSTSGLPPGLEFKSFTLCGEILNCKSEPEESLSQMNSA